MKSNLLLVCIGKPDNGKLVSLGAVCETRLDEDFTLWVNCRESGESTFKLLQMLGYDFTEAPKEVYEIFEEE